MQIKLFTEQSLSQTPYMGYANRQPATIPISNKKVISSHKTMQKLLAVDTFSQI